MKRQITGLQVQRKYPSRLSIFLDGKYFCGVSEEIAVKHQLKKGIQIDEEQLKALIYDDELLKARNYVYMLLSRRMYSVKEIQDKLKGQGYTDEIIKDIILKMESYGYVNDKVFAEEWVKSRINSKPKGSSIIKRELRNKGIEEETIENVLNETMNETMQYDLALELAKKRIKSYKNDDKLSAKRKLYAYLSRHGFSYDIIKSIMDEVMKMA
ncbi:MAG: regulatory protein RecX [Candidatus Poribacteria bacterium]